MIGRKKENMKFCDACRNMLYLRLDGNDMQYHCKNCATTVRAVIDSADSSCVIDNNYADDFHKQYLSPYIASDPTLPRTSTIQCINRTCARPATKPQEVIYVKYDGANMKFLYYCCHCGMFWKTK